jgi:hypothetical protein
MKNQTFVAMRTVVKAAKDAVAARAMLARIMAARAMVERVMVETRLAHAFAKSPSSHTSNASLSLRQQRR